MSTKQVQKTIQNLPKIEDLHFDIEEAIKNDKFNVLLNQPPPISWIEQNKYANNTNYIPIEKIETLLVRIFQQIKIEVISYSQLFNAVSCHIRLHYLNPVTNEWMYHDGVGAVQVQTKQGASPSDLSAINNNAVMMALPAAKSYALKDAAEHLGKLFGRDINRKDTMAFTPIYKEKQDTTSIVEKLKNTTIQNKLNLD